MYLDCGDGRFAQNDFAPPDPRTGDQQPGLSERLAIWKARKQGRTSAPVAATWMHRGLSLGSLPRSFSSAIVRVCGVVESTIQQVTAGLVGVAQDASGFALRPQAAWAVGPDVQENHWRRFESLHETSPAHPAPPTRPTQDLSTFPGRAASNAFALDVFYTRFAQARCAGGRVEILPRSRVTRVELGHDPCFGAHRFAVVDDGSFLACLSGPSWIVRVSAERERDLEAIDVVARSPLEFFQKLAEAGDPYFLRAGVHTHGSMSALVESELW